MIDRAVRAFFLSFAVAKMADEKPTTGGSLHTIDCNILILCWRQRVIVML